MDTTKEDAQFMVSKLVYVKDPNTGYCFAYVDKIGGSLLTYVPCKQESSKPTVVN